MLLSAVSSLALTGVSATVPEGAFNWKDLQKSAEFEAVAVNSLVPGLDDDIVMTFRRVRDVSFILPIDSPGVQTLTIAYISGGGFKPFTIYMDGKKLGMTEASGRKCLKILKVNTPDTLGKPVINLKSDDLNNIGILYIDAKPARYFKTNAKNWKTAPVPVKFAKSVLESKIEEEQLDLPAKVQWHPETKSGEKLEVIAPVGQVATAGTLFFSPRRFSAYWFKLTASTPAVMSVNGKIVVRLDKPGSKTVKLKWNQFRYRATRVIVQAEKPGQPLRFELATSALKGAGFLTDAPEYLKYETTHLNGWPRATIGNGKVTAEVALPDWQRGYCRGDRFDPSGILTAVKYNGHRYFYINPTPDKRHPKTDDSAGSIAGEFRDPIAYDDAKPGEEFIRVGVGTFVKTEERKPFFNNPYRPVVKFPFTTKVNKDSVVFSQNGKAPRGWAYKYEKTVAVDPDLPIVRVTYKLTNTGTKRIQTTHYAHNFFAIDGDKVNKNYKLDFNFPVSFVKNIRRGVEKKRNSLYLNGKTIFSELKGFSRKTHNYADVCHIPSGRGIKVTGDYAPFNYYLFVNKNAVCPEIFKWIDIAPGESCEWTSKYILY